MYVSVKSRLAIRIITNMRDTTEPFLSFVSLVSCKCYLVSLFIPISRALLSLSLFFLCFGGWNLFWIMEVQGNCDISYIFSSTTCYFLVDGAVDVRTRPQACVICWASEASRAIYLLVCGVQGNKQQPYRYRPSLCA